MKLTMFNLPSIKEHESLAGQRVLVRGSLNVPIEDGKITDDYRIQRLLPTVNLLRDAGARVILIGHLSGDETNSFTPVADYLADHFDLSFIKDYDNGAAADQIDNLDNGGVVLFENLRQYDGEKTNDDDFSQMLADYADIYVNEAFDAAHRAHASVVGVPKHLPAYAGLRFMEEVEVLSQAFQPEHPFTFILGGAKFSTKLPLVEKFSTVADRVFVGGALANAYLAADGQAVGDSRLPDKIYDLSGSLAGDVLELPLDVVCQTADGETEEKSVKDIAADDVVVDLGSESVDTIIDAVNSSAMVVWNGPLGWYEKGFSAGTDRLAEAVAKSSATSILGGGDTAAVVLDDFSADDFDFVSIAGGAMIQFLSDETLPGIEALEASA